MVNRKRPQKLRVFLNQNNKKRRLANKNKEVYSTKHTLSSFSKRSWFIYSFVLACFTGLAFHIYNLQIVQGGKYLLISKNNYIKTIPISPIRGNIYDANGIPLTESIKSFSLFISPTSTKRAKEIFETLKTKIYLTDQDWNRYLRFKRSSTHLEDIVIKANLNQTDIAVLSVLHNEIPEIYVEATYNRNYFYGSFFTHVLGYTGNISTQDLPYIQENESRKSNYIGTHKIGKIGLEKYYEELLHGLSGYSEVEVNSKGKLQRTINRVAPINGQNLYTNLDLPTQTFIARLISNEKAVVIVSNPQTGDIISMYSNPSYDPNLFVNFITAQDYNNILNNPDRPLINRATVGIYPPGSTIKPFIAISGLNGGFINTKTTIYDPGYWTLPGSTQVYRDWLRSGHGKVNLHKSIVESVDTYYYDLSYRMGITNINKQISQFGFGSDPVIDLSSSEISSGNLPNPAWKLKRFKKKWVPGDTPPVGIGQGYFTTTPAQLIQALNILLNDGINKGLKLTNQFHPSESNFQLTSNKFWEDVRLAMYGVNHEQGGSGLRSFKIANYTSGGKTGTAQVFNLKGGDYKASALSKNLHDHALYIGFAPYKNPEISIVVIVENGGGGSRVAAPVAKQIMDYYLNTRLPVINDPNLSKEEKIKIALNLTKSQIYSNDIKIKINDSNQD